MMRTLRLVVLPIIVLFVTLSSVALAPPAAVPQDLTPPVSVPEIINTALPVDIQPLPTSTPGKIKATPTPALSQAGNSDRIVLIGILIVGIIVIPILLRQKEWRGN
jgi:hypothetical protein